jgi:hypothetical protein
VTPSPAHRVARELLRCISLEVAQPVWKLKISKLDEKDILVFEIEIELACNASTSNDLE